MSISILSENEIFPGDTSVYYNLIQSIKNTIDEHSHDFFEVFLVSGGPAIHMVNGARQYLKEGSLVFIRPDDIHCYERDYEWDCQLINIAFSGNYCKSLFDYLDDSKIYEMLMLPKYPVSIELSQLEKYNIISRFEKLNTLSHSHKQVLKLELKSFIMELVSCFYGMLYPKSEQELPPWLETLIMEMQLKENFTVGIPKLLELACKTQEHLCREFKRHTGKTPTEFINKIRLNYAENLLRYTDISVTDICFDSGFENLSHFYHLFKKQFGTSPANFRRSNQRNIV